MGALGRTPRLVHLWGGKLMGATMWCWILWRFKHDWRDVLVRDSAFVFSFTLLDVA